jgi:cytosine/adenosine deaminase-related metal-dependent hydrolase
MASVLDEHGSGLTMHLAEIQDDITYFRERGTTPAKFLEKMGLLKDKTVYVHCVWLSDADIREFAKGGSTISHNPSSNMKLGSGIAPVVKMLKAGVNVALGTDGGPSNDTYDMLRECKLAALLQKVALRDPRALGYDDALTMAITNGYRSMGLEGVVGRVESGYRADFIVIDLDSPHLTPSLNIMSNIVYSATGQDVSHVFVDGRALMLDKKVTTLDEKKVLREARKSAASLVERAGLDRPSKA